MSHIEKSDSQGGGGAAFRVGRHSPHNLWYGKPGEEDEHRHLATFIDAGNAAWIAELLNSELAWLETPMVEDVDVAMTAGMIMLMGDSRKLCDLPGDKAMILRDMLTDMIFARMGTPIDEIEAISGNSVCRACGTVALEFDPPVELHAAPPQEVELGEIAQRHLSLAQGHALKLVLESMRWLDSDDHDAEMAGTQEAIGRIKNALKDNGDIVMILGRGRDDQIH